MENYPARTRTWNEGIKIPSVTITPRGNAGPSLARTSAVGNGERELLELRREVNADETDVLW
jgi:hypothetical protein